MLVTILVKKEQFTQHAFNDTMSCLLKDRF